MPSQFVFKLHVALFMFACFTGCAIPTSHIPDESKRDRITAMYQEYQPEFPGIQEVTPIQVIEMLENDNNVVIVDVREPEERAVSTLPGALSKSEFEEQEEELKGKKVVVYCTIGYRSGLYTQTLKEQGWDAYNMPGSILSWVHAGQPVVDESGNETKRVHVYGKRWDLLPQGYEAIY
ncbi:MAG: hypothetical protein COA73_10045 [Candidatus Hydrogenedentota bacterium]|nr:MAG: hypothetical protein COA73_10045 [Candidatus Hydrogenedentota bacterium]